MITSYIPLIEIKLPKINKDDINKAHISAFVDLSLGIVLGKDKRLVKSLTSF